MVTQGSVRERTQKPLISEDWTQIWHLITSAIFSLPIPAQIPEEEQCQRICGLFCTYYSESKKCALLIFASQGQKPGQKHKDKVREGQSSGILKISLDSCTSPGQTTSQLLDTWKHKPTKIYVFKLLLIQNQTGLIFLLSMRSQNTTEEPSQWGFLGGTKRMGRSWLKPCWFL